MTPFTMSDYILEAVIERFEAHGSYHWPVGSCPEDGDCMTLLVPIEHCKHVSKFGAQMASTCRNTADAADAFVRSIQG